MAFNWMNWLLGSGEKTRNIQTLTPEQQQFQQNILRMGQLPQQAGFEWLNQILQGDEAAFRDFEAPLQRKFEREILPGIAERFAGMGTGGAQDSSAFQQTLGSAARDYGTDIAQLRSGLKMNALQQLQQMLQPGFQKSFQPIFQQQEAGFLPTFLGDTAAQIGKAGTKYFLGS